MKIPYYGRRFHVAFVMLAGFCASLAATGTSAATHNASVTARPKSAFAVGSAGRMIALDPPDDEAATKSSEKSDGAKNARQRKPNNDKDDGLDTIDKLAKKQGTSEESKSGDATKHEPAPTAPAAAARRNVPDASVEVYVPSVLKLITAIRDSRTAKLATLIGDMLPSEISETDDGVDVAALLKLLDQLKSWPDTSIALSGYTQERDGRPRWAIRVDWKLAELQKRIEALLNDAAARKVLGSVKLVAKPDGATQLELPDLVLAVLIESKRGAVIASSADLKPARTTFEREADEKTGDASSSKDKPGPLIQCRQNLSVKTDEGDSFLTALSGVRDVRYELLASKNGGWDETARIGWSLLVGAAVKSAISRVSTPFDVPSESLATAAFNAGQLENFADTLTGLAPGTIGKHTGADVAIAVVPGQGFLPIPDVYFVFAAKDREKIEEAIRKAIKKDADKRHDEDRPVAWREDEEGSTSLFWRDPGAEQGGGIVPVTFRTIVFTHGTKSGDRLIIATTSNGAADVVRHWKELTGPESGRLRIPSGDSAHWQGRLAWKSIYAQIQPWLSLIAGFSEGVSLPPGVDEMNDALVDSVIDLRLEFSGLRIRHAGPIPLGAIYVPAAVATSISAADSDGTDSARERVAAQNLRVLHHHATLFRKDFDRWPSRVSELDGYVDFTSNTQLLRLAPQQDGILAKIKAAAEAQARKGKPEPAKAEDETDDVADSLYVIMKRGGNWTLGLKNGQFKSIKTIYIDKSGEVHRVEKTTGSGTSDAGAKVESRKSKGEIE